MAFLISIVFEYGKNFFPKSTEADTSTGQSAHSGERRDTERGHKRYYDEDELDVGLGLVTEEENEAGLVKEGGKEAVMDDGNLRKVEISYCIG